MSLARHRSRVSVLIAVLAAATAAAAVGAASAPAASMAVDCEGFQAALNQAGPGDVITLTEDCTEGEEGVDLPFELPARPSNQAPYTVEGDEDDAGTTIDGNDETRLLVGDGTGQVIIRNLTFRDGLAESCDPQTDDSCGPADSGDGGAIRVTGDSPLTIGEGNNFFSNHADGNGGGAFLDHTGTGPVLVYDNVFGGEEDENTAGGSGGGLYVESDSPVTVGDDPADETAGNLFELNEAGQGGGVAIVSQVPEPSPPERGITANGLMTLENNTLRGNQAGAGGGALVNGSDAPIFVGGNEFGGNEEGEGNFAIFGGGADVSSDRAIDVADNDFAGNLGLFVAGGLGLDAAQVAPTVTGNGFTGNLSSFFAGGAFVSTCNGASVDGNTFEGNRLDLNFQFPGGEGGLRALRGTAAAGTVSKLLAAREKGGFRFGAGLAALGSQCNGLERGGGPAPLTQADNRFRDNAIVNQGFESDAAGAGEYTQALELRSTNDRFVGNRIELAHNEQDGRGAGLAIEPNFQQVNVLRNLVAAGNEIVIPPRQEVRGENGADEPAGRGGGVAMLSSGADADLQVLDSTVEGNVAAAGSGIAGQEVFEGDRAPDARTLSEDDRLILHNSIVFDNTGHDDEPGFVFDGEVDGFPERDVQFTDLCVNGGPHDDGDGTDPNSNVCINPLLNGPVGDEDVDQTAQSPTIDAGSNGLVPDDLLEDYEGNPRIMDGNRDGTATVDMGAHEFAGATPTPTPTPVAPAVGCVNAVGPVRGRTLGPARLGRTRTAQRAIFRGAQLRARPGMDKYCASPNGLFRLGYPTGRILNRLTRGVRRAVRNRVVLILTTSRGVTLSGVRPGVTRSSEVPRRLRRTRQRVGKNTWFVTRTRAGVLLLIKVQGGLVREIGIGDGRLARGSSRQLKRYLKTWQALS